MNYSKTVSAFKFNWAETTGAVIEHFGGFPTRDLLGS